MDSENDETTRCLEQAKQVAHDAKLRTTELEGIIGAQERELAVLKGKLDERDLILKGLFHGNVSGDRQ